MAWQVNVPESQPWRQRTSGEVELRQGSGLGEKCRRRRGRRKGLGRRDLQPRRDRREKTPKGAHCQHHDPAFRLAAAEMASGRAPSSTPVPTTETAESTGATSTVTDAEWEAMTTFLKNVYDYRNEE